MTRGKNAAKAANRERAAADREAPLRRRIATLEKQVEEMDRANLAQQATHAETTKRLRIQVAAGTSEKVETLLEREAELMGERDMAFSQVAAVDRRWIEASGKMLEHLIGDYGDGETALQVFMEWCGQAPGVGILADGDEIAYKKLGSAGVAAIRRAQKHHGSADHFSVGAPRT